MKRMFLAGLALAAVLSTPAAAQDLSYKPIASVEGQVGFLELATDRRSGDQVTATVLWVFVEPPPIETARILMAYRTHRYDCRRRELTQLRVRGVASDGKARPGLTFTPEPAVLPWGAGTAGEEIGEVVCGLKAAPAADPLTAEEALEFVRRARANGTLPPP